MPDPRPSPEGGIEAAISVWREPNGYWSASVRVDMADLEPWKAYATSFHDIREAIDWTRQQADLAVEMV